MKFKCVNDIGFGLFPGWSKGKKIPDLTKGKVYVGQVAAAGGASYHLLILVFNDAKKWQGYTPELFVPVDE